MRLDDLTGKTFGDLRVLGRSVGKPKTTWWLCECRCGQEVIRSSQDIKANKRHRGCALAAGPDRQSAYRAVIRKYRGHAADAGRVWSLTDDHAQSLMDDDCHYCKAPPSNLMRLESQSLMYNGIDRVDNERGYEPDNVVSCCVHCNYAKRDRSSHDFLVWVHMIARRHREPAFTFDELDEKAIARHPVIPEIMELFGDA